MTSELFLIFISKILLPFSLMVKTYINKLFSDMINSNI
jgi:hypothetical protein